VAGEDVMIRLADLLYRVGTPRALEAILAQRNLLPPSEFSCVLRSALRSWPPSRVFEEFSPLLSQKKGAGKEKCAELERFVAATVWDKTSRFSPPLAGGVLDSAEPEPREPVTWDARWLDAAIKTDHQTIVCCLARPNHEAALDYLLKLGEATKTSNSGLLIRALVRCEYPKTTEVFLRLAAKRAKGAKYLDYELRFLFESARYLPAAGLPNLEAFAATLDEKLMGGFLEAIAPLRATPQGS
jgi:hypothetical protein